MNTEHFPYEFHVTIKRGENLVVKDLFSSDPYVVIRYGEKELRRTSIVFQNRTNPTWEQTFVIPLLHLCGGRLHFLVYDWDEGKEDDFMGRFSLDMSALTLDKEFPFDQLLLSETNERDGERGSLSGLLLLKKATNTFTVTKMLNKIEVSESTLTLLKHELDRVSASEPERLVLTQAAAELEMRSLPVNAEHLRDLLFDVHGLDEEDFHAVPMTLLRHQRELVSATRFTVATGCFSANPPMRGFAIKLVSTEGTMLTLSFRTRYHMWRWVRCLLASFAVLSTKDTDALPYAVLSGEASVKEGHGRFVDAQCFVTQAEPLALQFHLSGTAAGAVKSFDLSKCEFVVFSKDAPVSADYNVDIRVSTAAFGKEFLSRGASKCYLVLRSDSEAITTSTEPMVDPMWLQSLEIDVWFDDIGAEASCVHFFLFEKSSTFNQASQLLGEQIIPIKKVLDLSSKFIADEDVAEGRVVDTTQLLDIRTSLHVKIGTVEHIPLLEGQQPTHERDLLVKCSYFCSVDKDSGVKDTFKELKSHIVKGRTDANFSNFEFVLPSSDGLFAADFVRLRLFSSTSVKSELLGAVYIPVSDFTMREQENKYSLDEISESCVVTEFGLSHSITVAIRRTTTSVSNPVKIDVLCRARRSNQYRSKWHAECLPVSSFHDGVRSSDVSEEDSVELFSLHPAYKYLVLAEEIEPEEPAEVPAVAPHCPFGLNRHNSVLVTPDAGTCAVNSETIALFSYENERRGVLPPFPWGVGHLKSGDPPRFADESGLREFLFEMDCPDGYQWVDVWALDLSSGQTDNDGWSYGTSFAGLRTNYKRSQSAAASSITMLVRRRRWKRMAVLINKRKTSVTLATVPLADDPDFRERFAQTGSSDTLLKLCKEKRTLKDSVRIPWRRVLHVAVCSPSVLSVIAQVGKYVGTKLGKDNFVDTRVEIFVLNCCAVNLKALFLERIAMDPFRQKIIEVINFEFSTSNRDAASRTKEIRKNNQEVSRGSEMLQMIEQKLVELASTSEWGKSDSGPRRSLADQSKGRLSKHQSTTSKTFTSLVYSFRLRLYMCALYGNSLTIDHDFIPAKVLELVRRDVNQLLQIKKATDITTLQSRMDFIRKVSSSRVHDLALTGWSHKGGEFTTCLLLVVNEFFQEAVAVYGEYLDAANRGAFPSLDLKLQLIQGFLSDDTFMADIVRGSFQSYGLTIEPTPTLSHVISVEVVLSNLLCEVKNDFDKAFNKVRETWTSALHSTLLLPWSPISQSSGSFACMMPEELRAALIKMLDCFRDVQYGRAVHAYDLHRFRRSVEYAFVNSFIRLANTYMVALESTDWANLSDAKSPAEIDRFIEERSKFLSSVVNDTYRIESNSIISVVSPIVQDMSKEDKEYGMVVDRARIAYAEFKKIRLHALECISCVVFALPSKSLQGFNAQWTDSLSAKGVAGPFANLMFSITDPLESVKHIFSNVSHFTRLLEICADKVVVVFLMFVRDLDHVLSPEESSKLSSVLKVSIIGGFKKFFKDFESESNFITVELHLKRLMHLYYLLTDDISSEHFVNTTRLLQGESEKSDSDPVALSMLLSTCLRLRDWTDHEHYEEPYQKLVDMIKTNAISPNLATAGKRLYELCPESRVFGLPAIDVCSHVNMSEMYVDELVAVSALKRRNEEVSSWGLFYERASSKRLTHSLVVPRKKIIIKNVLVKDLFSLDFIGLAPNVYITIAVGTTVVRSSTKQSTYAPAWAETFEVFFESDLSLMESSIILSLHVYYASKIGLISDTMVAFSETSINTYDAIMMHSVHINCDARAGDSKAVQVAAGNCTKKALAMPKLSFEFSVVY